MGRVMYAPSMAGQTLPKQLPYFFDFVFALRIEKDNEGNIWRGLMTQGDGLWNAKQRGNALEEWEQPDIGAIIAKVQANE